MIFISLPISSQIGWGLCGRYITQELSRLADVRLLTRDLVETNLRDELDFRALSELLPTTADAGRANIQPGQPLDGPLLIGAVTHDMQPMVHNLRGTRTVGYTFFEDRFMTPETVENSRRWYDHIVAGSKACETRLRENGLTQVSTVAQGIDPTFFYPSAVERRYLRDQFVIFSGGKLELRKGHDVVVRAVKVLQDKYRDVLLMTAWHNPWRENLETIKASGLVRLSSTSSDFVTLVREFLTENGIDVRRTVNLGPKPNFAMARFYKQTDVGLFPNRCEGGTNLVLMEYMACGKPAIASFSTGHCDLMTDLNSLPLRRLKPLTIERDGRAVAVWDEPDLDEVVAALESAYRNRERLKPLAQQAGEDMKNFTWTHTAKQFLQLLTAA
jgi:glycosyltransferase involved in cell wall biosynthesis